MIEVFLPFDPEKRVCSANCPACFVSPRLTTHKENFTQMEEPLFTSAEEEAVGLCLVGGFASGTEVGIGDSCSFPDADFNRFAAKVVTRIALAGKTGVRPKL